MDAEALWNRCFAKLTVERFYWSVTAISGKTNRNIKDGTINGAHSQNRWLPQQHHHLLEGYPGAGSLAVHPVPGCGACFRDVVRLHDLQTEGALQTRNLHLDLAMVREDL